MFTDPQWRLFWNIFFHFGKHGTSLVWMGIQLGVAAGEYCCFLQRNQETCIGPYVSRDKQIR